MAMTVVPMTRAGRKEKWEAALRRAVAANLAAMRLQDGAYAIASETDEDAGYLVDSNFSCTCKAAQAGNPFCKHAALAMALAGILAWPDYEPEPEPPAPACRVCGGHGTVRHERLDPVPWTCPVCCGSGRIAA